QGCLAKVPDDRWQTVRDVIKQLKWIESAGAQVGVVTRHSNTRWRWVWTAVAAVAAIVLGWIAASRYSTSKEVLHESRFEIPTPEMPTPYHVSVSPDGQLIAFVARTSAQSQSVSLFLRALGSVDARSLPGTEGAASPFWSSDSRYIGFFTQG